MLTCCRNSRLPLATWAILAVGWLIPTELLADPPAKGDAPHTETRRIREYRSSRLLVRTDLPQIEAEQLYQRLEGTLGFAAQYWGRKPKGQIECFVVDNLDAWTDRQLPHRLSRVIIRGVGGATIPKVVGRGKQARNLPTVYASSQRGVAEHELVHAYCIHTFGSSGPNWYKEGMAEMAVSWSTRESGMQCSPAQIVSLQAGRDTSLATIFQCGETGDKIFASLNRMMNDPATQDAHVSTDVWTARDSENVSKARDEYLHSWAFCYMMLHNPNYSKRFRSLGAAFISQQRDAFDDFFAVVRDNIEFEHQQFLRNASIGYRVDLCAWDWAHRFKQLQAGEVHRSQVVAGKGFQPTGITVRKGKSYDYHAPGEWTLSLRGNPVDANGNDQRIGQLVGVIMNDHKLGDEFPLGAGGTWTAKSNGKLYLRCQDSWNAIADNDGQILVTVTAL